MPTDVTARWALLVAVLGTLGIAVLSLVPIQLRPHVLAVSQFEHVGAYFATAAAFAIALRKPREVIGVIVFLSLLAAALEVAQFWVPGRTSRISDWIAGTVGASAGVILVLGLSWAAIAARRGVVRWRD
jgi:VanZ family protein